MADLPELLVADEHEWRTWLERHHGQAPGVWLVLTKKGGDQTALTYAEAVQQALCFGWIDGQARTRGEGSSLRRFTPRRARSRWSAKNVRQVEQLAADGLMHPSGWAAVEAAKSDGRWQEAYEGPAGAVVPDDLAAAIGAEPRAQAMFEVLTSQNRYALIFRLGSVRTVQTRRRKIAEYVDMLARGETIYPQRRRPDR